MTTTKTTRKLTAANTPVLARIKKQFDGPIYRKSAELMSGHGPEAVRYYLMGFVRPEAVHQLDEILGDATR